MFKFISYWRIAAVVLCDMASTAYYIGGIVESQIGAAAVPVLLQALSQEQGVLRQRAVQALGRLAPPEALGPLGERLGRIFPSRLSPEELP